MTAMTGLVGLHDRVRARVPNRLVIGAVVAGSVFALGVAVAHDVLLRVVLLVAIAPVVVGLALVAPATLVVVLAVWLTALGLIRRLVDTTAGAVTGGFGDPLLLVAPMVLVVLAAVAMRRGAFRDRSRLANAVLALSVLALVEAGNPLQGSPLVGVAGLLFMLVPMLAFWVGRSLLDDTRLKRLLGVVVVLAVAAAVYGLVQQYGGLPSWDARWARTAGYAALHIGSGIRAFGTMSSSSEYVGFLGIGLVVCMASLSRLSLAPLAVMVGGLLGFGIFQDSSRGVVVLAVAAAAIMWAARRGMRPGAALGVGALGLVALVVAVGHASGAAAASSAAVQHQVNGLANPFNSADSTLPGHFSEMVTGLRSAFTMPIGHGTGSVSLAASRFGGSAQGTEVDPSNIGVALGLPGLVVFLVVVADGLRSAYSAAARDRSWWALALLGVLVVTFLQWTNGGQYSVAWLPWLVLGAVDRRRSDTPVSPARLDQDGAVGIDNRRTGISGIPTAWVRGTAEEDGAYVDGRTAVPLRNSRVSSAAITAGTPLGLVDVTEPDDSTLPGHRAALASRDLPVPGDGTPPVDPMGGDRGDKRPSSGTAASPADPTRSRRATWRHAVAFLGHRPRLSALLVVVALGSGITMSAVLAVLAEIAAALAGGHQHVAIHVGPLRSSVGLGALTVAGLGAMGVQILLQVALAYLPARLMADLQVDLRRDLFAAFSESSSSEQSGDGEGQFQELVTNQVAQVAQGTLHATAVVINGLMLAVMLVVAIVVGPATTLVVIGAGVVVLVALRPLNRLGQRRGHAMSEAQFRYAEGVHQVVHLSEEARVFGVTAVQRQNHDCLARAAGDGLLSAQFVGRAAGSSFQSAVMVLVLAGVAALQALHVSNLAALGVVVLLLVRGSTYAQQLFGSMHWLRQLVPYLDRVDDARRRYRSAAVVRGKAELSGVPALAFERISFAYVSGVPVLRNVSFEIRPGEMVGFAGPTGAGKSTIIQILLGLRTPDTGRYQIDGSPSAEVDAPSWARLFAYLPQEPRLMRGTVAENIRFFRDLDDEAVERAARLAHIHEEIVSWPNGYATVVGQRADAVSGGQRQRIGLARALAGSPRVLVLDEPTSALDTRSEQLIHQSLTAARGAITIIVVAHRLSTLHLCDRVIVVTGGRVEAAGAPAELASTSAYFASASATGSHRPEAPR